MKLNNKGISLLEIIVAMVIMCFMAQVFTKFFVGAFKSTKRIETRVERALAATPVPAPPGITLEQVQTRWNWVQLPNLGECKQGDAKYWVARTATRTVTLYKDASCHTSYGTLNATDNSRFANDASKTLWEVSGGDSSGPLRILLIVFP